MRERDLKVEYIDVVKLTPYERNCKIHTAEQIRHIASSIEQFGFNDPLGVWGEDNIVLEGNGRLEALRFLGIKEAPCLRLDHLSDEERRAYTIAHNHLNLETGFDEKELLRQLNELQDSIDLEALGIESEKYITRLNSLEKKELTPFVRVHYMISLDVNDHDKIVDLIGQIREIEGVQVESTLN